MYHIVGVNEDRCFTYMQVVEFFPIVQLILRAVVYRRLSESILYVDQQFKGVDDALQLQVGIDKVVEYLEGHPSSQSLQNEHVQDHQDSQNDCQHQQHVQQLVTSTDAPV